MGEHAEQHADLMREVALGELSKDSPEVLALLENCATCRELWEKVEGELADVREDLDLAQHVRPGVPMDVAGRLEELAQLEPPGQGSPPTVAMEPPSPPTNSAALPSSWLVYFAAAALLIWAAIAWWPSRQGPTDETPIYVGDPSALHSLTPAGAVDDFEQFEWRCDLPGVRSYTLRLYDEQGELHLAIPHLKSTSWTPTETQSRDLPDRLRWEVDACDEFGAIDTSPSVACSRP